MQIRPATSEDLPAVRGLLQRADLPLDDLDSHLGAMVVALDGEAVMGAAALEIYAGGALLRSVVVDSTRQGSGIGQRLTESALALAAARGLREVFLLTTTAERFFPRFGFETIARADVPASVQESVEFKSACPASAIVMRKRLTA